jgi:uncharacterized protein YkwD
MACQDQLKDLQEHENHFSHVGTDKSTYSERIERHCRWGGVIFEAMDFAPRVSARDIVISWLLDDGN